MKQAFKFVVVYFIGIVILSSCKKDSGNALLSLRLRPYMDTSLIVPGTSYLNKSGRNISFSRTSYYISNIQLTNTDGTLVPVSGIALVTAGTTDYTLGNIPTGNYKSISFDIGLNTNNHDDPASHSGSDPLATQSPSMHFGNNTDGYIFMAVEGLVDSSVAGTGTPTKTFSYHLGTDALLKSVSLGDHSATPYTAFTAGSQKIMLIDLIADFSVLTKGINISGTPITNTTDYTALADSLAGNIPLMFRYAQ